MRIEKFNNVMFDSMADLSDYIDKKGVAACCNQYKETNSWLGGVTPEKAVAMLKTGDMSMVGEAERLLGKMDVHFETAGVRLGVGVAGMMPSVPDFLGGGPEAMYHLEEVESTMQPLKIIVDTASSAGIDSDTLRKRGAIVTAAVLGLAATREITLEAIAFLDADGEGGRFACDTKTGEIGGDKQANVGVVRVAINTNPLDLASACYALCHSGFTRRIAYGIAQHIFKANLYWGTWKGKRLVHNEDINNLAIEMRVLGADIANTLFIPGIHLSDPMLKDPEGWVAKILAKYSNDEGQSEIAAAVAAVVL